MLPFEQLHASEEQAKEMRADKLLMRADETDLEELKADAVLLLLADLYVESHPEKSTEFQEDPQGDLECAFLKKRPRIFDDTQTREDLRLTKRNILTELRACEILKQNPHPNIVKYLGFHVRAKRVTGTYFDRFERHLQGSEEPLKVETYVEDIRKGIERSLGFRHNEINVNNITIRDDDTAVTVDFYSCLPVGEKLGKCATTGFCRDAEISGEENDWFGMQRLELWMQQYNEQNC